MKQLKVESLIFPYRNLKFSELFKPKKYDNTKTEYWQEKIQEVLDSYAKKGYRLVSTDSSQFISGGGWMTNLYFEKVV